MPQGCNVTEKQDQSLSDRHSVSRRLLASGVPSIISFHPSTIELSIIQPDPTMYANTDHKADEDPLQKARDDFAEKISVAGWKEAVAEPVRWIRLLYRLILSAFSIACVFLIVQGLRKFIGSGYTDGITDFAPVASIPMSNVTVCAQVYFNQTFVEENVSIPRSVLDDLESLTPTSKQFETSLDEFYHQLTIFLSGIMRPRKFSDREKMWFKRVIAANPHLMDFGDFTSRAVAKCEKMFKKCWLDGREFDCCSKAIRSYDDDGICHILALNMDSDNAQPSERTVRQHRSGPSGGLTIEASLPLDDFPWFEDDAQNGFRLIVGPVPFTFSSSPVLAPDLSETYVKVTPQFRILTPEEGCADRGQMEMPGGEFMYHDPEGFSCIVREFSNVAQKYAQCRFPTYFFVPNMTEACDPWVNYMLTTVFSQNVDWSSLVMVNDRRMVEKASQVVGQIESDWRSALSDRARCPNHCRYWTYDSTASFVYLDREHLPEKTMYSKIHVYYAEMAYRQHEQLRELTIYVAFCDFGNVVGLYWGMSIVSFVHVVFYFVVYVRAMRKSRVVAIEE